MVMTTTQLGTTVYALMVKWDEDRIEFVPATDLDHADRMARTMYSHRQCWTVGRVVQPWRYVRRSDGQLTDQLAI